MNDPNRFCPICETAMDDAVCAADGVPTVLRSGIDEGGQLLATGTMIASRYRIEGLVARGGMGDVYSAVQTSMNRRVAVKTLLKDLQREPQLLKRFYQDPETLDPPVLVEAPEFTVRWLDGAARFSALGCDTCHVPFLTVSDPVYRTETVSGSIYTVNLAEESAEPRPEQENGRWVVPVFSDFRRHDLGMGLAGHHGERGVEPERYLTRRLAGIGQTSPYLHDGSAVTFDEAVARHGGEAAASAQAYADLDPPGQSAIRVFLASLRRASAIRVR